MEQARVLLASHWKEEPLFQWGGPIDGHLPELLGFGSSGFHSCIYPIRERHCNLSPYIIKTRFHQQSFTFSELRWICAGSLVGPYQQRNGLGFVCGLLNQKRRPLNAFRSAQEVQPDCLIIPTDYLLFCYVTS